MGGLPSLGYEVKDRKLIVVEEEAERVWLIFRRYLDLGYVPALRDDLLAQGVVSKRRVFEDGRVSGGLPFSRAETRLAPEWSAQRAALGFPAKADAA
jgi:site-specific DNA recombinase